MDRRDLLKFGALAGVSGSSCASLLSNPGSLGAGEMNDFLSALDGALAKVMHGRPFDALFPSSPNPELAARIRHGEELTRKTLRSLLMIGTVGELPLEQQAHDGVQQRLRGSMGEFDDAMFGMTELLENVSPTDRAAVSKALRDDPELGMRMMGTFDQEAAAMGVSFKQRTKLRALSAQAVSRLKQSPDAAIAEYTGKVRRIAARHGAHAEFQRRAAASLGSALMWQQADGVQGATGGPPPTTTPADEGRGLVAPPLPGVEAVPAGGGSCITDKNCSPGHSCQNYRDLGNGKWSTGQCVANDVKNKTSPGFLTAGGIVLGAGAVGALILVAAQAAPIGLTVGAILGTIGIVLLVIGLIMLAAGN